MKIKNIKEMLSLADYQYLLETTAEQMNREVLGLTTACKMLPEGTADVLNYQRCKEMLSYGDYNKTLVYLAEDFLTGGGLETNDSARKHLQELTDLNLSFCLFPIDKYLTIPTDVRQHIGLLAQNFIDNVIKVDTFEEALYSTETALRAFSNQEGADALGTLRVEAIDLESLRGEALSVMTQYTA